MDGSETRGTYRKVRQKFAFGIGVLPRVAVAVSLNVGVGECAVDRGNAIVRIGGRGSNTSRSYGRQLRIRASMPCPCRVAGASPARVPPPGRRMM